MLVKTMILVSQEDYIGEEDTREAWQKVDEPTDDKNFITLGGEKYAAFDFGFYSEDISSVQSCGNPSFSVITLPAGTCIVNINFSDAFDMMSDNYETNEEDSFVYKSFDEYIENIDPNNEIDKETRQFMKDVFETARVFKSQIQEYMEENNDDNNVKNEKEDK